MGQVNVITDIISFTVEFLSNAKFPFYFARAVALVRVPEKQAKASAEVITSN